MTGSAPSRRATAGLSVGVDVGGTFMNLVARHASGALVACKVPTSTPRPADAVLRGLARVAGGARVPASLAHVTTIVTNAIVERRIAPVGLVTTRGFRDVLEIARQSRTHLYRLDLPARPEPLVPRRWRAEITERVAADGTILAAGVAAAAHVARTLGLPRALAFDMGGTTTDMCLIADGSPETASQRRLGDYPVRLPMVAVESIGGGGGSIARADAGVNLRVTARVLESAVDLPLIEPAGALAPVGAQGPTSRRRVRP